MISTLSFLIFSLFAPEPTQIISGTLVDYETKLPVESVMVVSRRGKAIVITDANGYFEMEAKGPGRTSDMGYGPGRYLKIWGVGYLNYNIVLPIEETTSLGTIEMFLDYNSSVQYDDSIRQADEKKYDSVIDYVFNYCFEFKGNSYALDFKEEIALNVVLTKEEYCD